jgi:hypothetical protein
MNILPIVAASLVFVVSCADDFPEVTSAGGSAASGTLVLPGAVDPTDGTGPTGPGTPAILATAMMITTMIHRAGKVVV